MCTVCGCGSDQVSIDGENHNYGVYHQHHHDMASKAPCFHNDSKTSRRMIQVEQDLLTKNQQYADTNRKKFSETGVFALNFVSSPGSGKTTLLVKTIEALQESNFQLAVIEGDQQTKRDAERIRSTGVPALQINTGKGCHLDAHMISHAVDQLSLNSGMGLLIENVGNLVCPASFDLGEAHKVVVLSITEGEDKPLKYPDMFYAADLMLLNKMDLLPYLQFDIDACIRYARQINPRLLVMTLSATRGDGMSDWVRWVEKGIVSAKNDYDDSWCNRQVVLGKELKDVKE